MKLKATAAIVITLTAPGAYAVSDFVDTAQVISSTPIVVRVSEPRQECFTEFAAPPESQQRNYAAPILGGLAGALLGRQVGHGNGRDVATAMGAAVGTMTVDAVANPDANRSYTGAALGAVAGGLLGNQAGNGSGKGVTTAAGTIAGTMIGDSVGSQQSADTQPAQRCHTTEFTHDVIKGYNVTYRYNGRQVTTALPYNPGNTVIVGVGIINDGLTEAGRDTNRSRTPPLNAADTGGSPNSGSYNYRN